MSATVTFELNVEITDDLVGENTETMSKEQLEDWAKEILYSAPAFDGIDQDVISNLEISEVEYEDSD